MLTEQQLKQYERDGYICLKGVVPQDALDLARTVLERWVDEVVQSWVDEGLLPDAMTELGFQQRLAQAWKKAGQPKYVRSPSRDLVSREMFDLLRHRALVDIAEAMLGTPEVFSHGVFNARPKLSDQVWTDTPWHQDAQYYQDAEHTHVISMWMALQKVTEKNSCLQVVPGFHKGKLHEPVDDKKTGFIGLSPEIQKTLKGISMEMEAGDLLCFTSLTPHRALPNSSGAVRWSMDVRFEDTEQATESGKNRGFIARSISDPSRVTSYEEWLTLWEGQPRGTY